MLLVPEQVHACFELPEAEAEEEVKAPALLALFATKQSSSQVRMDSSNTGKL